MSFDVTRAVREKIFTKVALMGPSGSGKTYSALRLAKGMAESLQEIEGRSIRIVMANTEVARGLYYANEFEYDIINVSAPHNPEKYVELVDFVVKEGYDILIMDSTSHEWEGRGGCLELQQLAGGTYQAWAKVTPRHNNFISAIADSPIHIIATMRGKDQYEMDKDEKGKTSVKKLGVGAVQRTGFEYEFTFTATLDQVDNMAISQKDNTHIFEKQGRILLSEKHGKELIAWANSGEGYTPPVRNVKSDIEIQQELYETIVAKCRLLGGQENEQVMETVKRHEAEATGKKASGNFKKIKDVEKLKALLEELETLTPLEETA